MVYGRRYSVMLETLKHSYDQPLPYADMALYRTSVLIREIDMLLIRARLEEVDNALRIVEKNGAYVSKNELLARRAELN